MVDEPKQCICENGLPDLRVHNDRYSTYGVNRLVRSIPKEFRVFFFPLLTVFCHFRNVFKVILQFSITVIYLGIV